MQYKILRATKHDPTETIEALQEEVNAHLADGWITAGGVSFQISGSLSDKRNLFFACLAVTLSVAKEGA